MRPFARGISAVSLIVLVMGGLMAFTATANAHERRNVQSYTFVVGWVIEPALVNIANNIDLRVSRTADATPVTGLDQTLKTEVSSQGKKLEVAFRPRSNTPGAYDGRMFPSAVGEYSFRIFGTIEGNQVNETFTSGPSTFGSIVAPEGFPNAVPINQGLEESISGLEQRVVTLEAGPGGSDSDTAMLVGIVGIIVGGLGLAVGGLALSKKSS